MAKKKVYLITSPAWEYNDDYSTVTEDGVRPVGVFSSLADAEKALEEIKQQEVLDVLNEDVTLYDCPEELQEMIDDSDKRDLSFARRILEDHHSHEFSRIVKMELK